MVRAQDEVGPAPEAVEKTLFQTAALVLASWHARMALWLAMIRRAAGKIAGA
ncbi:hypothetical protein [Desulfofundulus kuznetsovii]|uniref:hypothetical protein n=1 Tax=Desulfofundulus kuznetsovii TaxID=58135 RepID=UPI00031E0638